MSAQVDANSGFENSREESGLLGHSWELGLERSPFEDSPSAYYPIQQWEEHLRYLQRFRADTYPLLLIPGIVGSGKTTLVRRFVDTQNDPSRLHYLKAQPNHTLKQLLQVVYSGSELKAAVDGGIPEVLQQLNLLAKEVGAQLLFIDDAHRLPRETLVRLLHLLFAQDLEQSQFRVVLSGESQLQETVMNLLDTFASSRQVPTLELEALSLAQVEAYLEFRYAQAQREQKFPFTPAIIKQIHLLSGGFPGRVNRVAQQVFVNASRFDKESEATAVHPNLFFQEHKMKFVGAALFVVLFGLVWQFQPARQKTPGTLADLRSAVSAVSHKSSAKPAFGSVASARQVAASANETSAATKSGAVPALSQDVREAIAAAVSHLQRVELSEAEQVEESFSMPVVHNQHLLAGAALADERTYLAERSAQPAVAGTQVTQSKVVVAQASQPAVTVAQAPQPKALAAQATQVAVAQASQPKALVAQPTQPTAVIAQVSQPAAVPQAAVPAAVPIPAAVVPLASVAKATVAAPKTRIAAADSISGAELQLMAAKGYTIQIMGVRAPQLLDTFIAENNLKEATYYRTSLNQQDWYVLVYGNFQTPEAAKAALAQLPEDVRRQQPWVRSSDGVRQAIEVAHQKVLTKDQARLAAR